MTDETPTSEPTGDVDAHARMREPAEDEDVEAHGRRSPGGSPADDSDA